jgi:16S rRNA A1518/A1519 N6-dimethyltransferase RsmA/KsgA/DIM1 with predicted DNA glycosylase/AP lyase activity
MCLSNSNLNFKDYHVVIEPSAGNGSFYNKIKHLNNNTVALDIEPECHGIIKQDFFDFKINNSKVLVIGNPPFGKCCSLAIKFFNHSAKFADTIAFIIPRTFRRTSTQNKLDMSFSLVLDLEIPTNLILVWLENLK